MTRSTGTSGSTSLGSCPARFTALRMAARSTTSGTPVKSCRSTRETTNGISSTRSARGCQEARFFTSSSRMRLPSRLRKSDSSTMRRLTGMCATLGNFSRAAESEARRAVFPAARNSFKYGLGMMTFSVRCGSSPKRRVVPQAFRSLPGRAEIEGPTGRSMAPVRVLPLRSPAAALLAASLVGGAARAQQEEPRPWSLDLTVHDVGIGIGNSRHIDGLRLNFRDTAPFKAHGVNATIWIPDKNGAKSEVDGLALGLPATAAGTLRGLAVGFGVAAEKTIDGVAVGVLGAGSGDGVRGILVGGLGAGTGGNVIGIAAAGLGAGASGNVYGLAAGGLGAGAGGRARGIFLGGLGVGAGGGLDGIAVGLVGVGSGGLLRGIAIGGLGVGAGDGARGIVVGGLAVGSGRDIQGIVVGGLAVGSGRDIQGVAIAGLGVGAARIQGLAMALAAGGQEIQGAVIAPAYFHLAEGGRIEGVSISAFNRVLGEQRGLAIGLVNYASRLYGVQIGLVNWADNNPTGLKVLPVANAHFE